MSTLRIMNLLEIALQHLDEIPDYYTRLKKMESDAKKHHKKFKDVKEHCGCEDSAVKELESGLRNLDNTSYDSIDNLMRKIMKKHDMSAKQLHNAFVDKNKKTPDDWIEQINEEGLRDWFGKSKSKDGKSGWVNVVTGGTCASDEPGEGVPKCVSSAKRASMTKAERLSAARRKKAADPGQQQKSGAAKPTYVSTNSPKKKMKEETDIQEAKDNPGKSSGKKDACYHKVKSRYSVWPSAYASGALVKCRKVGADNWGTKSEAKMHEEERYCPLCDKRETRSECSYGEQTWDKVSVKDEEYSMVRSELQTMMDAIKRLQMKVGKGEGNLEAWVQSKITKASDYIDTAADYVTGGEMEEQKMVDKILDEMKCWPGYEKKGTQKLFGKKYNRCVKKEDVTIEDADGNTFAEIIDLIKPDPIKSEVSEATRIQTKTGNIIAVLLSWRGKTYMSRVFFPQTTVPSKKDVEQEMQKVYPGSRVLQFNLADHQPGSPVIVIDRDKNYLLNNKTIGEDWQSVNRKDKTDGLSQKAVNAYRSENPGSKLQTAVTEKDPTGKRADRRKSFCRRMKGMKNKLTSAETSRDPDSRINKALRRWNCN